MPTYEYQCFDCGKTFETIQKITEPPVDECPECKSKNVKRLISATAFHLKGTGWYKTDYSSGSSGSSSGSSHSSNGPASTEKKTEASSTDAKSESAPSKAEPAAAPAAAPAKSDTTK